MSMMADMLADMMKKALPPEVMAYMTPENMAAFKANAEALVTELREGIANVQSQNIEILARLERIENDGRNGSSNAGKRSRANNSAADAGSSNE